VVVFGICNAFLTREGIVQIGSKKPASLWLLDALVYQTFRVHFCEKVWAREQLLEGGKITKIIVARSSTGAIAALHSPTNLRCLSYVLIYQSLFLRFPGRFSDVNSSAIYLTERSEEEKYQQPSVATSQP